MSGESSSINSVHVLRHGTAIGGCFPGMVPRDWPEGHCWVVISDVEEATCDPCVAATKKLLAEETTGPCVARRALKNRDGDPDAA